MTSIDDDAREYGEHIKHGGWRLALLVARNVQKGAGNPAATPNDRYASDGKVSASEFARRAGTSTPRVSRHFAAWELAAGAGHVPFAADIVPGQEVALPSAELWASLYDASEAGSRPRDSKPINAVQIIEKRGVEAVIAEMPVEMQRDVYRVLTLLIEERLRQDRGTPIRDTDERANANLLLLAVARADHRVHEAVDLLRTGEVQKLDDDDMARMHVMIERIRGALSLLDDAVGGGVSDEALEAWLSDGAA